jgi:histidyl-tRNA synthetase
MDRAGVDTAAVSYDAAFGRALDYYTALVYEITLPDGLVLAGGGRYDRLLTMLGATRPPCRASVSRSGSTASARFREVRHERADHHRHSVERPAEGRRR